MDGNRLFGRNDIPPVIHHIGSTAIPAIQAKPIVDILVEISPGFEEAEVRATMERSGYLCMSLSDSRLSFNKGYTPDGYAEKVFHVHVRALGDNDEIRFRDYLRNNPAAAREYEALKLSLLPEYRHDRDGYTEAKSGFVRRVMELAGQAYETGKPHNLCVWPNRIDLRNIHITIDLKYK